MFALSAASDLTESIPTPAPNLIDQQLDGETLIDSEDNLTVSSSSSDGVYYDSIYSNGVSSSSFLPHAGNGKKYRHEFCAPPIVFSKSEVDDDELIIEVHRKTVARKSGTANSISQNKKGVAVSTTKYYPIKALHWVAQQHE